MESHTRRPRAFWLLLGLPAIFLLVVIAFDSIWDGGHPSLSAVLLSWGLYPTLTLYLSRALSGSEFPSPLLIFLGLLEYPVVGVGLASLIAKVQGRVAGARTAVVVLLIYISAQFATHLLLNLQSVNSRLMANANPAVSMAAVERIRESGDADAVPALQQKLVEDFERQGTVEARLTDKRLRCVASPTSRRPASSTTRPTWCASGMRWPAARLGNGSSASSRFYKTMKWAEAMIEACESSHESVWSSTASVTRRSLCTGSASEAP
jgi:hypothetical protein